MTVVAIHQPNFLPWIGFFNKIEQCDVFVILDDAQFPKTGGNWVNRTRIRSGSQTKWLTVPVKRASGVRRICDVVMTEQDWRSSHLNHIADAYRYAEYYPATTPLLLEIFGTSETALSKFNTHALTKIMQFLDVPGFEKLVIASTLDVQSRGTSRLIDLVRRVGGTVYLSGDGSLGYLEPALFDSAGIDLRFQLFREHPYHQTQTTQFVPGLSIVDSIFEVGPSKVRAMIKLTT